MREALQRTGSLSSSFPLAAPHGSPLPPTRHLPQARCISRHRPHLVSKQSICTWPSLGQVTNCQISFCLTCRARMQIRHPPGAASFTTIDSCVTLSSKKVVFEASPHPCVASRVQAALGSLAVILIFAFPPLRRVIPGNLKARYNQQGFGNEVFALSH